MGTHESDITFLFNFISTEKFNFYEIMLDSEFCNRRAMSSVGKRIKIERLRQGMTQKDLASRVDKEVTYISRVENDEFQNPRIDTVEMFARALGVDASQLMLGESGRQTAAADLLRSKDRPPGAQDAPGYTPNALPVVGLAQAGRGGFFDAQGYPVDDWSRKIHRPSDLTDPNAYALRVDGESMEPFIKKGHFLICSTREEPKPGDYVVVQLKSGEVMVKEYRHDGKNLLLKSINPLHEPVVVPVSEVRAVHPVVWIKRK